MTSGFQGAILAFSLLALFPVCAQVAPDDVSPTVRRARGRIFNFTAAAPGALGTDSPIRVTVTVATPMAIPELPAELSDTIAVGVIKSSRAFPTANLGAVYTEFRVRVEELISETSGTISAAQRESGPSTVRIAVLVAGGALTSESGVRATHTFQDGGRSLEAGQRYVFFLRSRLAAQCALPIKTWRLVNGIVEPMSADDVRAAHEHRSMYAGMNEDVFVGLVRVVKAKLNPLEF